LACSSYLETEAKSGRMLKLSGNLLTRSITAQMVI
jgi:hypothetical protein